MLLKFSEQQLRVCMLIISNNINTRNPRIAKILQKGIEGEANTGPVNCPGLVDVVESCLNAGANILEVNLQQHYDRSEIMEFAVRVIQQTTDRQLCLSSNNANALEAGLKACKYPPIINFVSMDTMRLQEIFPLVVKYRADVIFLVSDPAQPGDARQMLEKAAVLVGAANAAGIPDDRVILDPGIIHITHEIGQRHLVEIMDFLRAIPEIFEPSVRTTGWLSNSSAGAPSHIRPIIETTLLALLSGLGLSSVLLDILRPENKQAIRLLKIFYNKEVYADGNILV
jgi:cobalamin-dependent methionine synthase I